MGGSYSEPSVTLTVEGLPGGPRSLTLTNTTTGFDVYSKLNLNTNTQRVALGPLSISPSSFGYIADRGIGAPGFRDILAQARNTLSVYSIQPGTRLVRPAGSYYPADAAGTAARRFSGDAHDVGGTAYTLDFSVAGTGEDYVTGGRKRHHHHHHRNGTKSPHRSGRKRFGRSPWRSLVRHR